VNRRQKSEGAVDECAEETILKSSTLRFRRPPILTDLVRYFISRCNCCEEVLSISLLKTP
jgi:hypothetical protein